MIYSFYCLGADIKLKVFTENYTKLASVLPTKNLANYLVKEKIISIEEDSILQTTEQKQAAIIVLTKIHDFLEAYSTEKFDALISIMEQYT